MTTISIDCRINAGTRMLNWLTAYFFLMTGLACAQVITVGTVTELENAIAIANSSGGNKTIQVRDGTYSVNNTLNITTPNVTITGLSGIRENVVIEGDAMSGTARIGNVIRVSGSGFQLSNITLQKSGFHLIQIAGENNADSPVIKNCVLRDAYQQMIKVSNDPALPGVSGDNGLVENCLFEYTAGIGPLYYIGGIDAHGSKGWIVRNNTFRNIISPSTSVAEFAVHFWDNSANNTVERNLIVNCDRGIGFGLDGKGNTGGIIRNNMIYHANTANQFADTGIALIDSPNTQVYNNTIVMDNAFPWAIEYRFTMTSNVLIVNNLTNKPILSRDGASGTVAANVVNAANNWFVNPASGNLHLASAIPSLISKGQPVSGLVDDFDSQSRSGGIDIGADQFIARILPPQNLQVK